MTLEQKVEAYMRVRTRSMQTLDWWRAGIAAGTAPSEWDAVKYGKLHAMAWLGEGKTFDEAISLGFRAIYEYAYGDIRDSIRGKNGERQAVTATSGVDVYVMQVAQQETGLPIEVVDWIARSGLTRKQQEVVTLYATGYSLSEAAEVSGYNLRSVQRWFKAALPVLEGTYGH